MPIMFNAGLHAVAVDMTISLLARAAKARMRDEITAPCHFQDATDDAFEARLDKAEHSRH